MTKEERVQAEKDLIKAIEAAKLNIISVNKRLSKR